MAEIRTLEFNSWKELSTFIDKTFTHFNNYIFRGHADAEWKLESTLARSINKTYPNEKNIQDLIDKHLNSFKVNIRGKSNIDFQNVSDDELWTTGQHFGLFTPLLDFTKSPYVALFFALQGKSPSGKRCLWVIGEHHIQVMNLKQKNPKLLFEKIIPLTNNNPRLVSQQGLFLKIPLDCSVEQLIESYESIERGGAFFKIIFDDKFKDEALLVLQNMNITQLTLFPDLIGSALHSNFQFEIEPYLKKTKKEIWEEFDAKNKKK